MDLNLKTFLVRNTFQKQITHAGAVLYTGYAMSGPENIQVPPHFVEVKAWSQGVRRVWCSDPDRAVITLDGDDITVIHFSHDKEYQDELARQSRYYTECRKNRRHNGPAYTPPYKEVMV